MCRAVVAGEAGTIHAEDDGELLKSDVVNDGIECALEEGGVNGAEGTKAARGHPGSKDDGMLFRDADIEVAFGMMRPEKVESGAVGHGGSDGHDALVLVGEFCERSGEGFGVCGNAGRLGHAGFGIVGTEAVKFFLAVECGLKSPALLREDVKEDGAVLGLEELESLDEEREVVSVDGAVVGEAKLLKHDGGPEHAFRGLFSATDNFDCGFAADFFDDAFCGVVEAVVALVGDDAMEVASDSANVAIDGPLVVVEDDDEALGLLGDVVEGFEGDSVGEGCVAGNGNDVLFAAGEIARDGHAEGSRKGGAGMTCAVAVVLAFRAEHEAVEAAGLADGFEAIESAGKDLVYIGLMADIEDEAVRGRVEDGVEREGEFDDAEIGAEMASGFGEGLNEEGADFGGEDRHLVGVQSLEVSW